MTLPPFEYARPHALDEAAALLATDGARALAGGQSLVPALAARQPGGPRPRLLVDLARLPGLDTIALDPDGRLRIGALVRQRAAERSPLVARHAPLLAQALAQVGHPSTRNRGTVVGSLAHAEPAAEVPAVAVALGGVAVIAGPAGARRELPVTDLLQGPQRLALDPGELIAELLLDPLVPGERQAWLEFAPRRFDLPLVGVAARVVPGREPRLTLAGVAPTPMSVTQHPAEGCDMTLLEGLDPHRTRIARTLTRRALEACGR
ncbi:FAD binding domain-containing protein [Conexibacter stalactiti]|uniref:FAD binding domain-containing protein n=1 Tax=Conexibacter stalactiti TaxID=1940611 RepID=A0ABU4HTH9_9ACTN|nr:FAD binding domain-containing protein [Conexibacter stalactiti]MDW5596591.1 FAD binding domain-containing protein [Conexibacter stalactiti]MEC5037233.1 FAD binding domain-containing protein [Conexibacter stalactiti]